MKSLVGMIFILTTSCTEIFKTELPPIQNCLGDNDICSYTDSIQPIFDMYCIRCHGNLGGLDLTSYHTLMSGGNNGQIINESNIENSLILQRLTNETNPMPPTYDSPMIHENYIEL